MKQLLAGIALFLSMAVAVGSTPVAAESETKNLWQLAPPQPDPPASQRKPWVLRERDITLDMQLLRILKDPTARPHPRVTLEFFDGHRYEVDITSTVLRINDTAVIRGTFRPPSQGEFTLVASGSLLVGSLQVGSRLYRTEHVANGRLRLMELDPSKAPPE
ncbi:MAG TPA: hypothetical protein VFR82_08085 [Nitrospira sp.]|nr:hypothetical protein [Nitrospira sp.]